MSEALGDQFRLHVVSKDRRIVAGAAFLYDGNCALYGYGASTRDETILRHGVNQLAMWGALRQALRDGKELVDFGTSLKTQATLIAYKEKWGGRTIDCPHSVLEPEGRKFITRGIRLDRDSTGIRCASFIIRHMPLPVFRLVSPSMLKLVS
jgi:hypothetical protein